MTDKTQPTFTAVITTPISANVRQMAELSEQDAGLLEQAASMLEGLHNDERNRGNCSTAEGAACSADAVRRLAVQLLRAVPEDQAQGLLHEAVNRIKDMLQGDDGQAFKEARKFLERIDAGQPARECLHRIADMRNTSVASGFMCVDCGAIFAAAPVLQAAPSAPAAVVPVLYVSPGQLAKHRDLEGAENAEAGRYLPSRKTPAGKFTQPLYENPPAPAAVGVPPLTPDEARWAAQSADRMRGPSDTTQPAAYAMAGALALAAKLADAPAQPFTPAFADGLLHSTVLHKLWEESEPTAQRGQPGSLAWQLGVFAGKVAQAAAASAQAQDHRAAFKAYLQECDECAIVPDVAGAFNAGWMAPTRPPAQEHATQFAGGSQTLEHTRMTGDRASFFMERFLHEEKLLGTNEQAALHFVIDLLAQAPLQQRVQPWLLACFGVEIAGDKQERNHRFLEEAVELVQANGCTASEAHQLVDYVFGRPVGEPAHEVGGVMVTLAALCLANGLDMHKAGEVELQRIWGKVQQIRAKQAAKPKHSPLPAAPIQAQEDARDALRQAVRDYHYSLDTRQHGGVAAGKALDAIQEALGMYWVQGKELAARAAQGGA